MKRILLVLLFLAAVTSAFAADLKVTGDMNVRGIYDNTKTGSADADNSAFFDYDLNINAAFVANENATVFAKFTYDRSTSALMGNGAGFGTVDSGNGTAVATDGPTNTAGNGVVNIERAYLNYKFAPFAQVNAGLMAGGQWASTFGDKEINVMRVQAIGALSEDMVFILTYENNYEGGSTTGSNKDNDVRTYYASARIKAAGLTFLPLLAYGEVGSVYVGAPGVVPVADTYAITKMGATLGVNGDFGMIGLVSEFAYGSVAYDKFNSLEDKTMYGAYVDVFAKLDPAKVGVAFIYGSSHATKGNFEMGDDFNFTLVADDLMLGNYASAGAGGLQGMTGAKVYGEYKMDKLTLGGSFAYVMSTDKKVAKVTQYGNISDLSFWEIDANADYAMDANATYTIGGGYASIKDGDVGGDTTTAYRVFHKMAIKF